MKIKYIENINFIDSLESHKIDKNNWADKFPYAPKVEFKIAHNKTSLLIKFFVEEKCTMAHVDKDNGQVWTDSCVELFISPKDDEHYYNFEFNCIGKILIGYRKDRNDAIHAPKEVLDMVIRKASLGDKTFQEIYGDNKWTLEVEIPIFTLFKHNFESWQGLEFRMNAYKCGDNLSQPHYLSWAEIQLEKPDFHSPAFFKDALCI